MSKFFGGGVFGYALVILLLSSCQRSSTGSAISLKIRPGVGQQYTFFSSRGLMRTVDRLSDINENSLKSVMVFDPQYPLPGESVFVVDLTKRDKSGAYAVWVEPKGRWLDRVMPRLSVLADAGGGLKRRHKSKKTKRHHTSKPKTPTPVVENTPLVVAAQAVAAQATPRVVVYGTSWCPSCRLARNYFKGRGVKFRDIDVEHDQAAAQEMLQLQRKHGMREGAVPVIVIDGKVYQGFSKLQLAAALGRS